MLLKKIIANIGDSETVNSIPDFQINGSRVIFPGWLLADPEAKGEDVELPKLSKEDSLDLKDGRRKIQAEKKLLYTRLVSLIYQDRFERLHNEQGLDFALAWRSQAVLHVGKNYSLDVLEKLIAARRAGKSYQKAVYAAGLASTMTQSSKYNKYAQYVLDRALFDVSYSRPTRKFGEGVSLDEEQRALFRERYGTVSHALLAQELGISLRSISYWRKKLGVPTRLSQIQAVLLPLQRE